MNTHDGGAAFTPGPWKWWTSNSFIRLSSEVTGKDGDVLSGYSHNGVGDVRVSTADAELIAAAPDLLEAVRIAVRQNSHDMLMTGDELRICEAAIRRATGVMG
jgi:hypothetical protein